MISFKSISFSERTVSIHELLSPSSCLRFRQTVTKQFSIRFPLPFWSNPTSSPGNAGEESVPLEWDVPGYQPSPYRVTFSGSQPPGWKGFLLMWVLLMAQFRYQTCWKSPATTFLSRGWTLRSALRRCLIPYLFRRWGRVIFFGFFPLCLYVESSITIFPGGNFLECAGEKSYSFLIEPHQCHTYWKSGRMNYWLGWIDFWNRNFYAITHLFVSRTWLLQSNIIDFAPDE